MTKSGLKNEINLDFDDLISEVKCINCGKITFNIPKINDVINLLTCKECKELTIVHTINNGGITLFTRQQLKEALEKCFDGNEFNVYKRLNEFKNVILEIGCLGCGKGSFNMPFDLDKNNMWSCEYCHEITIVHIMNYGGISLATQRQKESAYNNYMSKIEHYLGSLQILLNETDDDMRETKKVLKNDTTGLWLRKGDSFHLDFTHQVKNKWGKRLQELKKYFTVQVKQTGLIGFVEILEDVNDEYYDSVENDFISRDINLSDFNEELLTEYLV